MKKALGSLFLLTVLLFAVSVTAADKVVVIPLHGCADGLTDCQGQCVDTLNNPSFCGDCTTVCGEDSFCTNGQCKKFFGQPCTTNSECLSETCKNNYCSGNKIVFATSIAYTGNLGGLSGADSKCQAHADAAGLPGVYRAWLSDSTQSPSSRFPHPPEDYMLVNGTVVAHGWHDLTDGLLLVPIGLDEDGTPYSGLVWTNTKSDGTRAIDEPNGFCEGWTNGTSGNIGVFGQADQSDSFWTESTAGLAGGCGLAMAIYCFEM